MNRTALDDLIDDLMTDDAEARHACWLLTFTDGTAQRVGAWPPMNRAEMLAAYRCADAEPDGAG